MVWHAGAGPRTRICISSPFTYSSCVLNSVCVTVMHVRMQGGAYGRDAGEVVFERESACGNGRVTVTAHAASPVEGPEAESESGGSGQGACEQQQWRVLRFNGVTRQSVARVSLQRVEGGRADALGRGWRLQAQPNCLAADYLKTVASAGARVCGLASSAACAARFCAEYWAHACRTCVGHVRHGPHEAWHVNRMSQCCTESKKFIHSFSAFVSCRQHVKARRGGCGSGGGGRCLACEATSTLLCWQHGRRCRTKRAA